MRKRIQKILIYFLTLLIVLANFSLLLAPKRASAAEIRDASVLFKTYNQDDESGQISSSRWERSNNTVKHIFDYTSPRPIVSGTYEQVYELDSNNPIVKYELTIYSTSPGGGVAGPSKSYVWGIPGLTESYSPDRLTRFEYKEISRIEAYKMRGEPIYTLGVNPGTTNYVAIFYKDDKQYLSARGDGNQPLDNYLQWINKISGGTTESLKNFFGDGTFTVPDPGGNQFIDHGTSEPPEILIKGYDFGDGVVRPDIKFKLAFVQGRRGSAPNDNHFYFVSQNSQFASVAIKIYSSGQNGEFVVFNGPNNWDDDEPLGGTININEIKWWDFIINRVYNAKAPEGAATECGSVTKAGETTNPKYITRDVPAGCINVDGTNFRPEATDKGWLAAWGVEYYETSPGFSEGLPDENTCGVSWLKSGTTKYFIAAALCAILGFMGDIAQMIFNGIFKNVFDTYAPEAPGIYKVSILNPPLLIQRAYAQDSSDSTEGLTSLDKAFTNDPVNQWPWVISAWKWCLGLANLFLVVVLLFLGVVNILHIQYDTYAIKKMLPLLIIGVILANFSLLIMRMLIDASNILTHSFMNDMKVGDYVKELITKVKIDDSMPGFTSGWNTVGGLLLAVFFGFFVTIAFLILGVMFYIRFAAIVFLGIIAPLAFVAMAFPPTQSVFKQWWSWASKMIFMKPISMFLIYLAFQIKSAPNSIVSITAWIIIVALVYMAILVPWKLGGVVMGMWGGAMGSLFGTKKGGWSRKGAKWLGHKAQYGMEKHLRWSPRSILNAWRTQAKINEEKALQLATGRQRDVRTRMVSFGRKKSDYEAQAERAWGMRVIKEEVGDVDLKSREGLALAFAKLVQRGDIPALKLLFELAAKDYMVADIMDELSPGLKKKFGYDPDPDKSLKTDFESQLKFVQSVIGEDDFEALNRIEESANQSGLATAKRHPLNKDKTGYEKADTERVAQMSAARAQSPDPLKFIKNFRIDSLFGPDGGLSDIGRRFLELNGLTPAHLALIARGFGRQSTYQKPSHEKYEKFWNDLEGFDAGKGLRNAITAGGGGPGWEERHAQTIAAGKMEAGAPVTGEIESVDIAKLLPQQITPEIKAELTARLANLPPQHLEILNKNIIANPNLNALLPLVNSITRLRQTVEKASLLKTQSRTDADINIDQIAQTIADEIGTAVKYKIDPRLFISGLVKSAGLLNPQQILAPIQEKLSQSPTVIIRPGGKDVTAAEIIQIYKTVSQAQKNDPIKTRIEFSAQMDKKGTSEKEKLEAWDLIEAFEGKAPREEKTQKDFENDIETIFEEEE